jgi:adenylate cyclase
LPEWLALLILKKFPTLKATGFSAPVFCLSPPPRPPNISLLHLGLELCYSQVLVDITVEPIAWLEDAAGRRIPIQGTCYIGRSQSNHLVLIDERVSRRHAMVHAQNKNEFWLVDLGSSNGTYLNGRRVAQPCRLVDQDRVEVGPGTYVFRHPKSHPPSCAVPTDVERTIQDVRSMDCWLLVADMEDSTQFIQKSPPEEAPRVTGRWLSACKEIIETHQGTLNKFLGDGFFAYWPDQTGASVTVATALSALRQLQERAAPRFRIVLHYGRVYVGGGASLGEESLLGNEVNFVFRMEKVAASLGCVCMVSERYDPQRNGLGRGMPEERTQF